jgi:hypothetical protein
MNHQHFLGNENDFFFLFDFFWDTSNRNPKIRRELEEKKYDNIFPLIDFFSEKTFWADSCCNESEISCLKFRIKSNQKIRRESLKVNIKSRILLVDIYLKTKGGYFTKD